MRVVPLLVLLTVLPWTAAEAGEETQVGWVGDWQEAFEHAKKAGKPVMVCINSLDGEAANERTAKQTYHDTWFVAMSRKFVMVVVSTVEHARQGPCPRFGKVSCAQHLACWKELRDTHGEEFCLPGKKDEMISPQHAWFRGDGTLLERREYELSRRDLLHRMRRILTAQGIDASDIRPPRDDGPLTDEDRAAIERFKTGNKKTRRAELGKLLATDKTSVVAELCDLLKTTKDTVLKCALLRAFGQAHVIDARPFAEGALKDEDEMVRSFAAVCLEDLGEWSSVPALIKALVHEEKGSVRRNFCRALGACGGPSADKAAAKALFKALDKDAQYDVRKHAAVALAEYAGKGDKVVRKRLERAVLNEEHSTAQCGIVYALAMLGPSKSTLRIVRKVLDQQHESWSRSFMESALEKLESGKGRISTGWLLMDDREDPARRE